MLVSLPHKSAIDSRFSVEIICNLSTICYPVTIEKSPQEHLFSVLAETAERFGAKTHECRTQLMKPNSVSHASALHARCRLCEAVLSE